MPTIDDFIRPKEWVSPFISGVKKPSALWKPRVIGLTWGRCRYIIDLDSRGGR